MVHVIILVPGFCIRENNFKYFLYLFLVHKFNGKLEWEGKNCWLSYIHIWSDHLPYIAG